MATCEGWIDMMLRSLNATGIDQEPVKFAGLYWALFFICFMILGNFLILNLFVGVVVSTFNREKEKLGKNFLLTPNQKKWLEQKKLCMGINPLVVVDEHKSEFRQFFLNVVQHSKFDVFILTCIIVNTFVLCIVWYDEPVYLDKIVDKINYALAIVFMVESICKIIAFGFKNYFRDRGNTFDFMIVLVSIVTSAITLAFNLNFGAASTFIRALRLTKIF